ncbi:MAG TPA: Arc family DNA-binding protein [Terriglobia bacterium]|nr:Arc family DNA-binding protein [Terriglobia bacterium]
MRSYTLRRIPDSVYELMQERAKSHALSLNAEVLDILSREAELERRRLEMQRNLPAFFKLVDRIARKHPTKLNSVDLIREDRDTR